MFFNSIDFAVFLPIVFIIYWAIGSIRLKQQNLFLVIASYVFYGFWDWRFLFLILFSSIVDFLVGGEIDKSDCKSRRKRLLVLSLVVNLGLLGVFKYFNFFVDNFREIFTFLGYHFTSPQLNLVLPVGISFYTFQTLSYSIDVYRKKLKATDDFIAFSAFVSFFPQLVAGPIERATNLLPQFHHPRDFDYRTAVVGLRQILWGLFKKVVIADNCAVYSDMAFNGHDTMSGSTLLLGGIFFAFQIYGDFSGYSDIAIGTSRLFGFRLQKNFAFPYFSRDIAEFWRRWHISLSTWFRDYLYIPLGGSRGSKLQQTRNVIVVFVVSGFWHGANWTFIIWGLLNALFFLPLLYFKKNRDYLEIVAKGRYLPQLSEFLKVLATFFLVVFTWIFFRSETLSQAVHIIQDIFSLTLFSMPGRLDLIKSLPVLLGFFIVVEWIGREDMFAIEKNVDNLPRVLRWLFYYCLILMIMFLAGENKEFIYFQF